MKCFGTRQLLRLVDCQASPTRCTRRARLRRAMMRSWCASSAYYRRWAWRDNEARGCELRGSTVDLGLRARCMRRFLLAIAKTVSASGKTRGELLSMGAMRGLWALSTGEDPRIGSRRWWKILFCPAIDIKDDFAVHRKSCAELRVIRRTTSCTSLDARGSDAIKCFGTTSQRLDEFSAGCFGLRNVC